MAANALLEKLVPTEENLDILKSPQQKRHKRQPKRSWLRYEAGSVTEKAKLPNEQRHSCSECGKSYVSLQKYLDHINQHIGSKP